MILITNKFVEKFTSNCLKNKLKNKLRNIMNCELLKIYIFSNQSHDIKMVPKNIQLTGLENRDISHYYHNHYLPKHTSFSWSLNLFILLPRSDRFLSEFSEEGICDEL